MTTQHYVVAACIPVGVPPGNEVTSNTVCHATVSRTRKDVVSSAQTSDVEIPPWRETPRIAFLIIRHLRRRLKSADASKREAFLNALISLARRRHNTRVVSR